MVESSLGVIVFASTYLNKSGINVAKRNEFSENGFETVKFSISETRTRNCFPFSRIIWASLNCFSEGLASVQQATPEQA